MGMAKAEAAACADKFSRENVAVTLTVTPCWCYGSETMDMDPLTIKAVWGFNGTDRPGAVYLAAVLNAQSQKGLPAFGIYGRDVMDLSDTGKIPADVTEKVLRFARAGLAAAWIKGKSYLSIGSVSMGIAGSIVDAEFKRALEWVKKNCAEGADINPPDKQHSCKRMAMIVRDLMIGNPDLKRKGLNEEALGHNPIAAGFQGQRAWTDHFPNGVSMLFGHSSRAGIPPRGRRFRRAAEGPRSPTRSHRNTTRSVVFRRAAEGPRSPTRSHRNTTRSVVFRRAAVGPRSPTLSYRNTTRSVVCASTDNAQFACELQWHGCHRYRPDPS